VGEVVRVKCGCVWCYGRVGKRGSDGFYDVSYGNSQEFENYLYNAYPLSWFSDFQEHEMKHLNEFKNNKYHGRNIDEIRSNLPKQKAV